VRISPLIGQAHWSREGRQLVSSGIRESESRYRTETWQFNAEGSRGAKLPIRETDIVVYWSPDGAWLLVASDRERSVDDRSFAIRIGDRPTYAVRPDGSDDQLITEGGATRRFHRFAPDSRRIIYLQLERDEYSLWIVNVDGSGRHRVVSERENLAPFEAVWSPDGALIAVSFLKLSEDETPRKLENPSVYAASRS